MVLDHLDIPVLLKYEDLRAADVEAEVCLEVLFRFWQFGFSLCV